MTIINGIGAGITLTCRAERTALSGRKLGAILNARRAMENTGVTRHKAFQQPI